MHGENISHTLDLIDEHGGTQLTLYQYERGSRYRKPEMRAGIYDVVRPMRALDRVVNFWHFRLLEFGCRARQAVGAANFLNRFGCNRECLMRNAE